MSHNSGYGDNKLCEPDRDSIKCKSKHPKPQKILMECGEGTGSRTFTSSNDVPFQLAHVTLDTTCLNRPEVLIKFSSLVNVENLSDEGTVILRYELFRVCEKEDPKSLGIWVFEGVNIFGTDCETESFSFIFCEVTKISKCCEYFVTVTPIEIINATSTVSNGMIASLSQSSIEVSKEEYKNCRAQYNNIRSRQKHPIAKEILLECGMGNGNIVFRDFPSQPPAEIAHVTIDTGCLNKPKVLIEFSSLIKIDQNINIVRIQFQLLRVKGDGEPLSLGSWLFERIEPNEDVDLNKAFSFIFCECEAPLGCLEYFVTVTPIEIVDIEGDDQTPDVVIDNARITALAQSTGKDICEDLDNRDYCIGYGLKHSKPKKILLECGEGNGSRTFTSSDDSAFQLAQVILDTTSLCKPIVNIEFSSLVSFQFLDFEPNVQLRYELFRVCSKKRPKSLGIWTWERIDFEDSDRFTNTFDFTFCSCSGNPSNSCEYFVVVTPVEVTQGSVAVTVSNGRIAALAQESC